MSIAICGGAAKGIRLRAPQGRNTRPTLARVREAIFSAILSRIDIDDRTRVLDVFGGSGALGLEAWSRGAGHVTFIEADRETARIIGSNVKAVAKAAGSAATAARVLCSRVPQALEEVDGPFDLVFLDPPYDSPLLDAAIQGLEAQNLLAVDAMIVVEHSARATLEVPVRWDPVKTSNYGQTGVSWYFANP